MLSQILWGVGIIVPAVSIYYLKVRYKSKLRQLNHKLAPKNYYHCLFITFDNFKCRPHIMKKLSCKDDCSFNYLEKIVTFIGSARRTIQICMYFCTLEDIKNELIKAHKRGVIVRIITDPVMFKMKSCIFSMLKYQCGFEVKVPNYRNILMHHKFMLVDGCDENLAKMMMGSLNLTMQGFTQNFDFVVFTNDLKMIQSYSDEFERLWNDSVRDIFVAEILEKNK